MKKREKMYYFRLSKLVKGFEGDSGLLLELMRSATHILAIRKLMGLLQKLEGDALSSDDEVVSLPDLEGIFVLNLSVAQLREATKLFWRFTESNAFRALYKEMTSEQRSSVDVLSDVINGYSNKDGLIKGTMEPLRNIFYHCSAEAAAEWFRKKSHEEKGRKPLYFSIDLTESIYEPGAAYDEAIFSEFIFLGTKETGVFASKLKGVVQLQKTYLQAVGNITNVLLKHQEISKGWKGIPE